MGIKKEKEKKQHEMEANRGEEAAKDNLSGQASGEPEEIQEEPIKMVMLPAEDVEKLKDEACRNLENWQRERADFLNYKKRIERDNLQLSARITGDVIKKYLSVQDDLERALKAVPDTAQEAAWLEGIDLIYRKLQNILDTEGVKSIPAETFDPNWHEAISHEPSQEHASGEIIEIVQKGYMLGDRVLRPAQVRVAK